MIQTNLLLDKLPDLPVSLPWFGTFNITHLLVAAGIFIGLNLIFYIIKEVLVQRIQQLSARTNTRFDDVIVNAVTSIRPWVYSIVSVTVSLSVFDLPYYVTLTLRGILFAALVWQGIEIALKFVEYFISTFVARDEDDNGVIDPGAATASSMIVLMSRIILWVLGGLFVLSNLGIEITSLIAGLGIGGVAVAFALQGILSDLFASFSIYFDRPFRVGDFVILGADSGTVEKIGIKSTRIRTLQGEELVVSNTELTTTRVQNFKKMSERRIVTQFGITYETPHELVQNIPDTVRICFSEIEGCRLDRIHFTTFGDSALIFEVVYFITSADYTKYLDIQQKFNLDLMKHFAMQGIEFAYPTQTLYTKTVS